MRILRCWLLLLTLLSCVQSAWSEPAKPSFSLEYAAPRGCPSRAAFLDAILRRAQALVVPGDSAQVAFTAHIQAHAALFSGRLLVESEQGLAERTVVPAPCHEVVESMAVIAALILASREEATPERAAAAGPPGSDAPAIEVPQPAAPPPPAVASSEPPATSQPAPLAGERPAPAENAATAATSIQRPTTPTPGPTAPREQQASSLLAAPEGGARSRLRPGLSLAGGANSALAPRLSAELQSDLDLWLARQGVWSPSVRSGFVYAQSRSESTPLGSARFRLLALRLQACPVRFPARSRVFVRPCARFDIGRLKAWASGTAGVARAQRMPWLGGGVTARLEIEALSWLGLEVYASLLALTRTDSFTLEPGAYLVHEVPRFSGSFGAAAAFRWP